MKKAKTAKKAARKAATRKRRPPKAAASNEALIQSLLDRLLARTAVAAIETAPPAKLPPTSIRRNRPEPKEAPAKAKAAMSDAISGWERAFIASVLKAGGVTAKQQPRMDLINSKLKASGEATIDLPRRKKGDPTPGQLAKAGAPAAATAPRQALGRGFADIELTRLVAEAIRGATRGLTMGGLYDALSGGEARVDYRGVVDAVEHLKAIGAVRERERNGSKVFLVA